MASLCPCVSCCVFECKVDWSVGCSKLLLFQVVLLFSRGGVCVKFLRILRVAALRYLFQIQRNATITVVAYYIHFSR